MDINPASLIKASAGRDKGKYMLVLEVLDKDFVLVCDGRRRRVENPKKKKLKQMKTTPIVCIRRMDFFVFI